VVYEDAIREALEDRVPQEERESKVDFMTRRTVSG
jgi:hypothetical protein